MEKSFQVFYHAVFIIVQSIQLYIRLCFSIKTFGTHTPPFHQMQISVNLWLQFNIVFENIRIQFVINNTMLNVIFLPIRETRTQCVNVNIWDFAFSVSLISLQFGDFNSISFGFLSVVVILVSLFFHFSSSYSLIFFFHF